MTWLLSRQRFRLTALAAALISLAACDQLPNDPERTEALVRETGVVRLGWVHGAKSDPAADRALRTLGARTGARIERHEGESEAILRDLAEGKLDLVYGHFSASSPWAKEVHLGRALGWRAKAPPKVRTPRFAMRNGENGWIMQVEAASRP
jgi:DNA-binding transcriptional LysR family regulator